MEFDFLFSLLPSTTFLSTMGKKQPMKRPGAPGGRKPAMAGKAKKKKVTFREDAKDYDGNNPAVNLFMMALLYFLTQRDQTRAQIACFVGQRQPSKEVSRCIGILIKNMDRAIQNWKTWKAEAEKMVTLREQNPRSYKKVLTVIAQCVPQPWLFPNGCRGSNERVPVSERRLNLLKQVKEEVDKQINVIFGGGGGAAASSGGGGAAAPPAA